jgi:hypothetical protein
MSERFAVERRWLGRCPQWQRCHYYRNRWVALGEMLSQKQWWIAALIPARNNIVEAE